MLSKEIESIMVQGIAKATTWNGAISNTQLAARIFNSAINYFIAITDYLSYHLRKYTKQKTRKKMPRSRPSLTLHNFE
jgi:hypothetical protein